MNSIRIILKQLKTMLGVARYLFLLRCILSSKKLLKNSDWSSLNKEDSSFFKRLALTSMIYLELQKRYKRREAFEIIKSCILPIGMKVMINLIPNENETDAMERLLAFFVSIRLNGVGKFVSRKIINASDKNLEYEVRECIFSRFFSSVGTPELAQLFCRVDEAFFPQYFPEFEFSRGTSFKNTSAFGNSHCNFIFKLKSKS